MSVLKFKNASGAWTAIEAIKGDKGDKGATGATGAKGDKGDKGDTGDSGVYVGDTAPTGGQNVWIDTSGEDDFEAIVQALYDMLPVAEEVEF